MRPLSAEVRLELARALQYSGRVGDAVPHYAMALPAFENDPAVLAEGANVMRWAGRGDDAARWLARGLALHPHSPDLRVARAGAAFDAGAVERAEGDVRAVLAAHPDHAAAKDQLALIEREQGDPKARAQRLAYAQRYAEARSVLRDHLAAEDPSDLRPRLGLANVDLWSGDHRAADRQLREILTDDPGHEGAQGQLRHLEQVRAPALLPRMRWFRDSDDFSFWSSELGFETSPAPGRFVRAALEAPQISGEEPVLRADGSTGYRSRHLAGFGARVGLRERIDRRWQLDGELGVASYTQGGASPRVALGATWFPADRHALLLEGRYEDAVLGVRVLRKPSVDVFFRGGARDFDRPSPSYYSPRNLYFYAGGVRLQHKFFDQLELRLTSEMGQIRSREGDGDTVRWAPELVWEPSEPWHVSLIYDHYDSIRSGSYKSDYVGGLVRFRFPVRAPRKPAG